METERLAVHAMVVIRVSIVRKVSSSCSTDRFLLSLNALMTIYNSYFKIISMRPVKHYGTNMFEIHKTVLLRP